MLQTLPSPMLLTCMWVVPLGRLLLGSRKQTGLPLVLLSAPWNGATGPEKNPSSLTNQQSAKVHEGNPPEPQLGSHLPLALPILKIAIELQQSTVHHICCM